MTTGIGRGTRALWTVVAAVCIALLDGGGSGPRALTIAAAAGLAVACLRLWQSVPVTESLQRLRLRTLASSAAAREGLLVNDDCLRAAHAVAWQWTANSGLWVGEGGGRVLGAPLGSEVFADMFEARLHPDDRSWMEEFIDGLDPADGGGPYQVDFRVLLEDGAVRWLQNRFGVEWGPTGRLSRISGLAQDVSARKNRERDLLEAWQVSENTAQRERDRAEELRRAEAHVRGIFETVTDALLTADESGHLAAVNPAAERLFGYAPGTMVGVPLAELIPVLGTSVDPEIRAFLAADGAPALAAGREVLALRADGRSFAAELSVSENRVDNVLVWTGVVRDVTERVEYECELRRARSAAEKATEAKSAFLANMSHEIRTPLTAVIGFAEVLADSSLDAEQADAVGRIRRSGEHLLVLINDILDLSKIEAGQISVEQLPCSPVAVVRDVIADFAVLAEDKGVALELVVEDSVPCAVKSDPTRLRQVVLNLIGNAIKFTDSGAVRVEMAWHQDQLIIGVEDTGVGMTEAERALLFRPFQQADASTSRRFGGTGLGLAISRKLCRLLGGDCVLARTVPGAGSRFECRVAAPTTDVGVVAAEPQRLAARTEFGGRVLVVEDGADNQVLVRRILEKAGASVEIVADGSEALARLLDDGARFDVVLMDMQMPIMDGYTATRALRREGYGGPIVALTANAMDGDRQLCLEAGCDAFAPKPVRPRQLLEALHAVTDGLERSSQM